jgi:hypothetical protein
MKTAQRKATHKVTKVEQEVGSKGRNPLEDGFDAAWYDSVERDTLAECQALLKHEDRMCEKGEDDGPSELLQDLQLQDVKQAIQRSLEKAKETRKNKTLKRRQKSSRLDPTQNLLPSLIQRAYAHQAEHPDEPRLPMRNSLYGTAGVGKTETSFSIVDAVLEAKGDDSVILGAMSGVAAQNMDGETIDSLGLGTCLTLERAWDLAKKYRRKVHMLLDEISLCGRSKLGIVF